MPKALTTLLVTISLFGFISSLYADDVTYIEAKEIVKNLPCSEGGTINKYLNKKASIPAMDDLGWKAYPLKDGFEIERLMLLMSGREFKLSYRWHVSFDGTARPANGKAISLTPE